MSLVETVSYTLGGGLLSADESHSKVIDLTKPYFPNNPEDASEDEYTATDFEDGVGVQNTRALANLSSTEEGLFGEGDAAIHVEGPGDTDTGMSNDHRRDVSPALPSGIGQANIKTVEFEDTVAVSPLGISKAMLTEVEVDKQLTEISPTITNTAASGSGAISSNVIVCAYHQSGAGAPGEGSAPSKQHQPGKGSGPGRGRPHHAVKRGEPLRREEPEPSVTLVREARRVEVEFRNPYNFGEFWTTARRRFYPIDSLMPREETRLTFQIAIMYRTDKSQVTLVNGSKVWQKKYRLLCRLREDTNQILEAKYSSALQKIAEIAARPHPETRQLTIVRIFVGSPGISFGFVTANSQQDILYLQDGRDTDRLNIMHCNYGEESDTGMRTRVFGQTRPGGRVLREEFSKRIKELLGPETIAAIVKMHRYPEEPLTWREDMSDFEFVTEFLWKIDHPIINVYPVDWRPRLTFEEAEEERAAGLTTEVPPTQQQPQPTQLPTTPHQGGPGPMAGPQLTQGWVTGRPASQNTTTQALGGTLSPPAMLQGDSMAHFNGRLDNIERILQTLVEQTVPTFVCPHYRPACSIRIPVEPRDSYETRVNAHLNTHIYGGYHPCTQDLECHARMDLMNAHDTIDHNNMHSLYKGLWQSAGPQDTGQQNVGPGPVGPPLLPGPDISPQEPPPPGQPSPSVPGSEESDVTQPVRGGAYFCNVCQKDLTRLAREKRRSHLNGCGTKMKNLLIKEEATAAKKARLAAEKENKKRKAEDISGDKDDDNDGHEHEHGKNQDGDGNDAGAEGRNQGGNAQGPTAGTTETPSGRAGKRPRTKAKPAKRGK